TAFSVTSCEAGEGFVDVLSVTEGTVDAEWGGKTNPVNAGESVTFCTKCAEGEQPMCGPPVDAGLTPSDATLPTTPDAEAPPDMAPMMVSPDAGVAPDLATRSPDVAQAPDLMMVTPDAMVV